MLSKEVPEQGLKLSGATLKARRHLLMGLINVVDGESYFWRFRKLLIRELTVVAVNPAVT